MTPGQHLEAWWHILRSGIWKLSYLLPAKVRNRLFVDFFPALHDTMVEVLGERASQCYYLTYIGTKPNSRKKGYAGSIIKHMMQQASKHHLALEAES